MSSVKRFCPGEIGKRWNWLVDLLINSSLKTELKAAITQDCKEQGVDRINIKRIAQDYDTQLLRIVRLFQKDGIGAGYYAEDLRQLGSRGSRRVFKSRTARLLSGLSGLFESRYVAKLVRQSGLFDQQWYKEQYPDVESARVDPALHYVRFGAMEGRNPNGTFDTLYYLHKHRDLVFKQENPLLHFLETREGEVSTRNMGFDSIGKPWGIKSGLPLNDDQEWFSKFCKNNKLLTLLEPNYLGIRQSASQFVSEEQMLFLREDMDDSAIDYYVSLIIEAGPQKILIQGFPRSYLKLIRRVRKSLPNTPIFCIYHGSFTQQIVPAERKCLQTLIELHREGVLNRLGLVKEGMAETLQTIGVDSRFVMNFMTKLPPIPSESADVSVGIVGSESQIRKPLFQQIAACKHFDCDEISIVGSDSTVVEFCKLFEIQARHLGNIPQNKMPAFLASKTINLYVTLTECAPMLPLESLAEGVPCLFGPNNHFFSDHPYLRSRLMVDIPDSETRIASYARAVIEERHKIISEYREYARSYNLRAMKSFEEFLEI